MKEAQAFQINLYYLQAAFYTQTPFERFQGQTVVKTKLIALVACICEPSPSLQRETDRQVNVFSTVLYLEKQKYFGPFMGSIVLGGIWQKKVQYDKLRLYMN